LINTVEQVAKTKTQGGGRSELENIERAKSILEGAVVDMSSHEIVIECTPDKYGA